jgi:hypothetical protein
LERPKRLARALLREKPQARRRPQPAAHIATADFTADGSADPSRRETTVRHAALVLAAVVGACSGLSQEVTVSVPVNSAGTVSCEANARSTVDLSQNADFQKYAGYIESAELVSVTLAVTAVATGNKATVATGTGGFVTSGGTTRQLVDYSIPLQTGASVLLTPDPAAAQALMDELLAAPHTAQLVVAGTADATPCLFSIVVGTDVRFTVSPGAVLAQ